jgi:hypothetical protein
MVYAYDSNNMQLGSSNQIYINSLQPGQSLRQNTYFSTGYDVAKIVFCTSDPYTEVVRNNLKPIY